VKDNKEICPVMSRPTNLHTNYIADNSLIYCQEKRCKMWGIVKEIENKVNREVIRIYDCRLIRKEYV